MGFRRKRQSCFIFSKEYNGIVRSGGPQAGHAFYNNCIKYINRQIPCGVLNPNCLLYLSSNSLINIDVLASEIRKFKLYPNRLMIDNHAMVVISEHIEMEKKSSLKEKLASTIEGVGQLNQKKFGEEENFLIIMLLKILNFIFFVVMFQIN